MKKILATILALTMVMSLGAVAFADDYTSMPASQTGDVTVTTTELSQPDEPTYLVTITIPDMSYTYNFGTYDGWSTSDLKYSSTDGVGWQDGDTTNAPVKNIELENKSDAEVTATASYASDSVAGTDGITVTVQDSGGESSITLDSAVNEGNPLEAGTAGSGIFNVKVTGAPTAALSNQKIGTVTIALAAAGA